MNVERRAAAPRFHSVLFRRSEGGSAVHAEEEPDYFRDLNLDQVLQSMISGREEYDLSPLFYSLLHDVAAVWYRHEVLRDLERPGVLQAIARFAERMTQMRAHLDRADHLYYELQRQSWFVDAVEVYCDAVRALADELPAQQPRSEGLIGLCGYLAEYVASPGFISLVDETTRLRQAFGAIRYSVLIQGGQVTVTDYAGDADYSEQVQDTFARFRQGRVSGYRAASPDTVEMNHVEAQILDGVASLHTEVFARRANYCVRHGDYLDETIARFDREVQFYVAYLELIGRPRAAGLPFCYPQVSTQSKEIAAVETFDIALADKLVREPQPVVRNDLYLEGPERMFVVSGPNNGGKTTFARTFGQLHHLAGLGLLVPGREARLFLPDCIYTHFEKEEDISTLRGKFEDELVRVHEILDRATASSVIVMNESFSSTTLNDALFVGSEVIRRILELECLGVYVTFVDELASLADATVSMVTQIVPENPTVRTFKVLRRPADGLAYAWAIAEKYGLTYERVIERIGT
jgi:DNA mismatch repair protein MutS